MTQNKIIIALIASAFALSACGNSNIAGSFGGGGGGGAPASTTVAEEPETRETIWDVFNGGDPGTQVRVNKFLWQASLDTLSFLPLEAADPFTGIMVFGYGRAPGSSRSYRATVHVSSPVLEASSLKVAIQTRGGTASAETQRQVENAILSRARQIRIGDARR